MLFTIFSLCIVASWSFGQSDKHEKDVEHYFSFGYHTGWNSINFTPTVGNLELQNTIGRNRALRGAYRLNLNDIGYAEFGAGFGFQTERARIPVAGFEDFGRGIESTGHFVFTRLDVSLAYQLYAKNKHAVHVLGGAGFNLFAPVGSGFGYQNQSDDEYFYLRYDVNAQLTPFINFGASYQFETKRQDLLGIKLYYNYGWKQYFQGSYSLERNDEFSEGSVESLLQGIHLGLAYTFTRNKKQGLMDSYQSENGLDRKTARKQHKFEKRAIDPESRFVSLGIGGGVTINKFNPRNDPFYNPGFLAFLGRISYEQGWKNNLFFEADYHGFYLTEAAAVSSSQGEISFTSAWGGDVLIGHFLSGGLNYKIQRKKTNFQFFTVHAGVGLGAQFYPKGDFGGGSGGTTVDNQDLYSYTSSSEVTGNLMPIIYTGISKDIRITQKLLFSLAYRYQFGFNTVYRTDYLVSVNSAPATNVVGRIDGTAALFTFGLKYRIK